MRTLLSALAVLCLPATMFSQNWLTAGNSGTTSSDFIGTTDNQPLIFRANNTEAFRLSNTGNFLLGKTTDGGQKFQLSGRAYFQTNQANGFVISNDGVNNHVSFDGTSGELSVYRFRSMNFYTNEGNSIVNGGYFQLSNNATMTGFQQPVVIKRVHPAFGTSASFIIDNLTDSPVPANYRILSAKLSGSEVAYINETGGAQFSGNTLIGTTTAGTARLTVVGDAANNTAALSVRQNSYAVDKNIMEITNASGVTISKFDHGGRLIMTNTGSATNPPFLMATRDLTTPPSFAAIPMAFIQPGAPDQAGIIIRALDGQNASSYLQDWQASNHTSLLRMMSDGKLGIGVSAPAAQLHTSGTVRFGGLTNDNAKTRLLVSDADGNISYRDASSIGGGSGSISGTTNYLAKYSGTTAIGNSIVFDNGSSVGIGTVNVTEAGFKLYVEQGIRTRKVKVDQAVWADYVFEPDYNLPTLKEVEAFIRENKHLPDVPSAKVIEEEGLDLGGTQAVLLKKIEELTLYIISQNKRLDEQEARMKKMEALLNK